MHLSQKQNCPESVSKNMKWLSLNQHLWVSRLYKFNGILTSVLGILVYWVSYLYSVYLWVWWYSYVQVYFCYLVYRAEGIGKSYQHASQKAPTKQKMEDQFWGERGVDNLPVLFLIYLFWLLSQLILISNSELLQLLGTCELVST